MNKQALSELRNKCHDCIAAWKRANWGWSLDIELGGFVEQCRMYGGDEIQNLYDEVWDGAPEDDPEVQRELWKLERHLFMLNLAEVCVEDPLSQEQKECIYFGKRIAMLRAEQGMTQEELADKVGIKRDHVARIEAGKYNVGLKHLAKIAKALNTELDLM